MSKIYQKSFPAGKNAGLTRIELLVVVLIIGILAAVALPRYEQAVKKTRLMRWTPFVKALANAEESYWMANGRYTPKIEDLDISYPSGVSLAGSESDTGYVKFSDGTLLDLLRAGNYISDTSSQNARISVAIGNSAERIYYVQYLSNSAYPDQRFCSTNESLCKSLGGTGNYTLPDIGTAWKLP